MAHLREEEVLNLTAERQYSMGRRRFILIHGILLFGIPMFCIMSGFEWYSYHFDFKGIWLISWLLLSLTIWCAIGYMFGRYDGALLNAEPCAHGVSLGKVRITGYTEVSGVAEKTLQSLGRTKNAQILVSGLLCSQSK